MKSACCLSHSRLLVDDSASQSGMLDPTPTQVNANQGKGQDQERGLTLIFSNHIPEGTNGCKLALRDYESAALTVELRARVCSFSIQHTFFWYLD